MNRKIKAAFVTAMMAVSILAVPASAQATPAEDVHYCLDAYPSSLHAAVFYEFNSCGGRTIRSKIVIAWGPDSSCKTLSYGQSYTFDWWIGSFDGLVAC